MCQKYFMDVICNECIILYIINFNNIINCKNLPHVVIDDNLHYSYEKFLACVIYDIKFDIFYYIIYVETKKININSQ